MIRSIIFHDIPMNDVAAMERWHHLHVGEIVRRFGPWLTRYDSYFPVPAPDYAQIGFYNWRLTDGWWREMPEPGPGGNLSFTLPPLWAKVAIGFIEPQATFDFKGSELQPHEKSVLRWLIMFRYPDGVGREEGDEWFLKIHAKEVAQQPGLSRFFCHRTIKEPIRLPGSWPPGSFKGGNEKGSTTWDWVVELWYETFGDWRNAVIDAPPQYTIPSWAKYQNYPFLEPNLDFISTFILKRPNDEFLRDSRCYL